MPWGSIRARTAAKRSNSGNWFRICAALLKCSAAKLGRPLKRSITYKDAGSGPGTPNKVSVGSALVTSSSPAKKVL